MALDQYTLGILDQYQEVGDYQAYYQTLIDAGETYGYYGIGASTDGQSGYLAADFAGKLANNYLERVYTEVTGQVLTETQKDDIRKQLITELIIGALNFIYMFPNQAYATG